VTTVLKTIDAMDVNVLKKSIGSQLKEIVPKSLPVSV